jgi:hypothetical protein
VGQSEKQRTIHVPVIKAVEPVEIGFEVIQVVKYPKDLNGPLPYFPWDSSIDPRATF